MHRLLLFVSSLALAAVSSASASVVLVSTLPRSSAYTTAMTETYWLASDFLTGTDVSVVTYFGIMVANYDTSAHWITADVRADNGSGAPGAIVGSFNQILLAAGSAYGLEEPSPMASIPLAASTKYWLVMRGDVDAPANGYDVETTVSSVIDTDAGYSTVPGTDVLQTFDSGATWSSAGMGQHLMFSFEGEVISTPEPSRLLLLGLGCVGIVLRRKRQ